MNKPRGIPDGISDKMVDEAVERLTERIDRELGPGAAESFERLMNERFIQFLCLRIGKTHDELMNEFMTGQMQELERQMRRKR